MRWSDVAARPTDRKLREFAAAGSAACLLLATWQVVSGHHWIALVLTLAALAAGAIGWRRPRWLAPIFQAALIVTFPLAWFLSLVVLALVFGGLIVPLGLLFRLLGRDALDRRLRSGQASYWKDKPRAESARRYLRQY